MRSADYRGLSEKIDVSAFGNFYERGFYFNVHIELIVYKYILNDIVILRKGLSRRKIDLALFFRSEHVVVYKILNGAYRAYRAFADDSDLVFGNVDYVRIIGHTLKLCESVLGLLAVCLVNKDLFCIRIGRSVRVIPVYVYGKCYSELRFYRLFEVDSFICNSRLRSVAADYKVSADVEILFLFFVWFFSARRKSSQNED